LNDVVSTGTADHLYRLESVAPVAAPDGGKETWYRYVIVQGTNTITGMRSGALSDLNPILLDMVERLNERAGKQRAKLRK
jgi:hypothetical protein